MIIRSDLRSQSVGGLLLYLFPSLSGSPVMSGDLARSATAGSSVCLLVVETSASATLSTVSPRSRVPAPLTGPASPSGLGRGPLGTGTGFLSRLSRGRPRPALAQLTS